MNKKPRPKELAGKSVKVRTGCGPMYVTLNSDDEGIFEVFAVLGKAGSCTKCVMEGISRVVTLALRCDVDVKEIVKQLKGLQCPEPVMFPKPERVLSCPDGIAKVLEEHVMGTKTRKIVPSKSGMGGLEDVNH